MKRAGHRGNRLTLGSSLFQAILDGRSGVVLSEHHYSEMWSLLGNRDRRVHLEIPEMLAELAALPDAMVPGADYPFVLAAGERRSYNANQIYRDPAWRKVDPFGAMRIHPDAAAPLGLLDGGRAICRSERAELEVVVELDDGLRRGMVTLPHGYGIRYRGGPPIGPELNRLTSAGHCDPFTRTPFHKYVPVSIRAPGPAAAAA